MFGLLTVPLGPLDDGAFTIFGAPTTWGEVLAFITGAWCVWLVAKQNPLNWPLGIANAVFFFLLFREFGLYADSSLQILYVVLGAYGWWAWLRGGSNKSPLELSRTTKDQWVVLGLISTVATVGLAMALTHWTDSNVPWFDALTTVLSLAATWGQSRKKVECWWLWISADLIYIPLYGYKDLWLTSILYIVFLALCVRGLIDWNRGLRTSQVTSPLASRSELEGAK